MSAEPFLMSGAARLLTTTALEQSLVVALAEPPWLVKVETTDVAVPGPVVVEPESIEYPSLRAAERYGTIVMNAARRMRATITRAAALWDFGGLGAPPSGGRDLRNP